MGITPLLTAEAFLDMRKPHDRRVELVDGKVIERPFMVMFAGVVTGRLLSIVGHFVEQHDLGLVVPGVGCVLRRDPDTVRAADVSFIARDRIPASEISETFWEGCPTLAVEVVSPDDRAAEVHAKVHQFLEAGTKQVWVLWPERQSVTVHDQDGARELRPEAHLDGGDVLPGFSIRVSDLFKVG